MIRVWSFFEDCEQWVSIFGGWGSGDEGLRQFFWDFADFLSGLAFVSDFWGVRWGNGLRRGFVGVRV